MVIAAQWLNLNLPVAVSSDRPVTYPQSPLSVVSRPLLSQTAAAGAVLRPGRRERRSHGAVSGSGAGV
jgi:hypothetical protein